MNWSIIRQMFNVLRSLWYNVGTDVYTDQVNVVRKYLKTIEWFAPVLEGEKTETMETEQKVIYRFYIQTMGWRGIVRPEYEKLLDNLQNIIDHHLDSDGKIHKLPLIKLLRSLDQYWIGDEKRHQSNVNLRDAKYLIEAFFPMYIK